MPQPKGYLVGTSDDTGDVVHEHETITCIHCQRIVRVAGWNHRTGKRFDPGGLCRRCMKMICGPCADHGRCTPFEAQLELSEKREAERRRFGLVLGGAKV